MELAVKVVFQFTARATLETLFLAASNRVGRPFLSLERPHS